MNAERLKQIEEIYHQALKIQPAEFPSFLQEKCGADEELRREIESLLSFENSSGDFLETPPASLAAEMFADNDKEINLIDKEIGHYKIIKLLGRGGMGEVFLAEDENLNRQVALKFLPAELTGNADRLQRFKREAQTASGLNHPNILTIHQFKKENESLFIVTEFVNGLTLSARLASGRLALSEILNVATQVAAALAAAHEAGIIHRDIKPDNIMIRADGFVKVLDFGLAKLIEREEEEKGRKGEKAETLVPSHRRIAASPPHRSSLLTNPGMVMGTADYMSPEQASGKAVDARTDIFSFGVLLFEMLTGQKPFTGETVNQTIVNILEKETPSVFDSVADCPAELEQIIRKTLVKKADERFESAKELLPHLKKLQKRLEFEAELRQEEEKGRKGKVEKDPLLSNIPASARLRVPEAQMPPNNLTENSFPIIGREKEVAEISDLLKRENVRLLTMTGIGGTGKTRLAQTVAKSVLGEFSDGVFFVALASITDYRLVVSTIANTLGVKEAGGEPVLDTLKNYLRGKEVLLVIDNFEQVIEAATNVAELLESGDRLKILITSRENLRLSAEREYDVLPLDVPNGETRISFDELSKNEAVRFFVERARFADRNFSLTDENADSIAEICRRLDGLPLAIELAAARIKLFSPAAILTRLSDSLKLLTGGAKDLPERQQTMRGAVAWSYDLLDADEKKMFNRLGVFVGGFTLDGAEEVVVKETPTENKNQNINADIDVYNAISSLLDKSLIIRSEQSDGEPRFRMLVVVREFALEKLAESGKTDEIKRRYATFCADFAENAGKRSKGEDEAIRLDKLEQEHDNLRSALDWSLNNEPPISLRIVCSIYEFWARRGYLAEGSKWIKQVLEKSGGERDAKLQTKAYIGIGYLSRMQGNLESAESFFGESVRLSRELGDKQLISVASGGLGIVKLLQCDLDQAKNIIEGSLAIAGEINDRTQMSSMLNNLGEISRQQKDYEAARAFYEESLAIGKQESLKSSITVSTLNLASVACLLKDYESAKLYALEALEINEELGDKIGIGNALDTFAVAAGKTKKSAELLGASHTVYIATGYKMAAVDKKFTDDFKKELRVAIGGEAFDAAYAEGLAMSMEDAIALARQGESENSTELSAAVHTTDETKLTPTNLQMSDTGDHHTGISTIPVAAENAVSGRHIWYKSPAFLIFLAVGALLGGLSIFGVLNFYSDSNFSKAGVEPLKQTRLTTLGSVSEAAISADGKFLAFIVNEEPRKSLYVRNLTNNKTTKILPSPETGCRAVTFSPDGKYIYFLQRASKTSELDDLYRIKTSGGEPQKLIADVDSAVSFAPNGNEFVFRRNSPVEKNSKLFIADSDGTNERLLAVRPISDGFANQPVWSPDGKTIASLAADKSEGKTRIALLTINAADGKEMMIGELLPYWAINLAWMPGGDGLLINGQVENSGPNQILRMTYPNGELSNVSNDFTNYNHISVTADGKSLVTVKTEQKTNIFTAPLKDLKNMRQLTSFDGVELRGISWTRDGKILYSSNGSGKRSIWIMNGDGTEQRQLTDNGFQNFDPVMSPDGRYIVYVSNFGEEYHVWRMDADGGNPVRLTGAEEDFDPSITPDSQTVVYSSIAPRDPYAMLWKVPIEGGTPVKLTDGLSRDPVVSPDGNWIAFKYWKGDDSLNGLSIMPVSGGIPQELNVVPDSWRWTADSNALIYADGSEGFSNLFRMDLPNGKPRQITDFKSERIFGFDISGDGKNAVFLRGTTGGDVVLISNYR